MGKHNSLRLQLVHLTVLELLELLVVMAEPKKNERMGAFLIEFDLSQGFSLSY